MIQLLNGDCLELMGESAYAITLAGNYVVRPIPPIEPRAALMLDLPKGIGGVVTSSPAGSGALLFW